MSCICFSGAYSVNLDGKPIITLKVLRVKSYMVDYNYQKKSKKLFMLFAHWVIIIIFAKLSFSKGAKLQQQNLLIGRQYLSMTSKSLLQTDSTR